MAETTQLPATIHFPSGWRRAACIWMVAVVVRAWGGKVVRNG